MSGGAGAATNHRRKRPLFARGAAGINCATFQLACSNVCNRALGEEEHQGLLPQVHLQEGYALVGARCLFSLVFLSGGAAAGKFSWGTPLDDIKDALAGVSSPDQINSPDVQSPEPVCRYAGISISKQNSQQKMTITIYLLTRLFPAIAELRPHLPAAAHGDQEHLHAGHLGVPRDQSRR